MHHFPTRAVHVLALLLLVAAMACGSASETGPKLINAGEGGTVVAVGGKATIIIPPGALTEDIEITVSKIEVEDAEEDELTELAAYEFGPTGTIFSKPVELSLVLPVSMLESGFRLVHFENAAPNASEAPGSTPMEVDDIVVDEDGENATIRTTLSSFSSIKVYRSNIFRLELRVPVRAVEGVPFQVEARTSQKTTDPQILRRQVFGTGEDAIVETITSYPESEWGLYGAFRGGVNVSPERILFSPPETAVATSSFTVQADFTCTEAGSEFTVRYFAAIDVDEVWKFSYSDDDIARSERTRESYEQHIKLVSGECLAPAGDPSPTSVVALPTSTPDPLGRAAEVFLVDPTEVPSTSGDAENLVPSVQLANGMTVQGEVTQWGGNPNPTLKRSWAGSVELLRYTLILTISGESSEGGGQEVEYQVFAVEPTGLLDWTDVIRTQTGATPGDLEESVTLPWAGDYIVKGSVGEERFELAVLAVEPEIRYGILAEPGTWKGHTPLDPKDAGELADLSGEWSGWVLASWLEAIENGGPVDVLKNQSMVTLERTDLFLEPLMTGVQQTTPDGGRTPYEMIVPRATYEGTFSYYLPAFSYEDGNCGNETVEYQISGTVNYAPNNGPWSTTLVLTGTLSGPHPKLAQEVPQTVNITVIDPSAIDRERMSDTGGAGPIVGPFEATSKVGFNVAFSDFEPNTASTITDDSTCISYITPISLVAVH